MEGEKWFGGEEKGNGIGGGGEIESCVTEKSSWTLPGGGEERRDYKGTILLNLLLANGNFLFDFKLVTRNMLLLLNINVSNGAFEPVTGVKVPVAKNENRSGGDNDNSVVHVLGRNGASAGEDKEDGDDDDPNTGDDTDGEGETTQGNGAVLKGVAGVGNTAEGRETI